MMRLLAIARNAFTETIRQPIYGVLVLITFAVLVLEVPLATWTMGTGNADYEVTDQQLMVSMGLSTLLVSGLFIAAFSAAGVLSREIEERTVLTVVSKPVSRPTIIAGKYLGVAGALGLAFYLGSLVLAMTVRHKVMVAADDPYDMPVLVIGCGTFGLSIACALFCNYFFGWHFTSSTVGFSAVFMGIGMAVIAFVGKGWTIVPFGTDIPTDLLVAMLLEFFCVLVFAAVAVAASTRLGQLMTLLVCLSFFFAGSLIEYILRGLPAGHPVTTVLYLLLPNLTFFYVIDALANGKHISGLYVLYSAGYMLCYVVAILGIGMAMFQKRELEASGGASTLPSLVNLLAWGGRVLAIVLAICAMLVSMGLKIFGPFSTGVYVAVGIGLALVAVGGWVYWGVFARGAKWAYWTTLAGGIAVFGVALADLILPASLTYLSNEWLTALLAASAPTVVILLLPKTRGHFGLRKHVRTERSALPGQITGA